MSQLLNQPCPCGSGATYADCCHPIHQQPLQAATPEQLMRARFCAHILKLVDFVVTTYHSSCQAESQREGIEESVNLEWTRLEVIDAPEASNDEGFVEFKAYLIEDGSEQCMHERSRFIKEEGQWYYIEGAFPEEKQQPVTSNKVGRNDPCPCGSGKKFKKCCG